MTNRIFRSIFTVAFAVMLCVSALIMGVMYNFSSEEKRNELRREAAYVASGIEMQGMEYLEQVGPLDDTRMTWIASDGAVLYDVKDKRYLATNGLDRKVADAICAHADEKGYHYFRNVVWENVLLIYYNDFKDFKNEAEKQTYLSNRRSPYRNYVNGEVPESGIIVYILLVLRDEEADELERELREKDTKRELHFLRDKSETPEEYCHLKIYHKNATKEYMLQRLMETIPQKKYVAFGSNKNDLSMLSAAEEAGFTSSSNFYKAFFKVTGKTPKDYL